MNKMMTIGEAVSKLKGDYCVARRGWNGKGMFLFLVKDDVVDANLNNIYLHCFSRHRVQPYIMMFTADRKIVPWLCSQADLLAEDWVEIVPAVDQYEAGQINGRMDDE